MTQRLVSYFSLLYTLCELNAFHMTLSWLLASSCFFWTLLLGCQQGRGTVSPKGILTPFLGGRWYKIVIFILLYESFSKFCIIFSCFKTSWFIWVNLKEFAKHWCVLANVKIEPKGRLQKIKQVFKVSELGNDSWGSDLEFESPYFQSGFWCLVYTSHQWCALCFSMCFHAV